MSMPYKKNMEHQVKFSDTLKNLKKTNFREIS